MSCVHSDRPAHGEDVSDRWGAFRNLCSFEYPWVTLHRSDHLCARVSPVKKSFSLHVSTPGVLQSPGFPDSSYPPNVYLQWRLRADPGHRVRLDFHTLILEDDCQNDFIQIYDSLAPIGKRVLTEWGPEHRGLVGDPVCSGGPRGVVGDPVCSGGPGV